MKALKRFKDGEGTIYVRGVIIAENKYDVLSYISTVGWITPKVTTRIGKKMDTEEAGEHMGKNWFIRWDDKRCLFIPRQSDYMLNLDELKLAEEIKEELKGDTEK